MGADAESTLSAELDRARDELNGRVPSAAHRAAILERLCRDCSRKLIQTHGVEAWRRWFERLVARYNRPA